MREPSQSPLLPPVSPPPPPSQGTDPRLWAGSRGPHGPATPKAPAPGTEDWLLTRTDTSQERRRLKIKKASEKNDRNYFRAGTTCLTLSE